MPSYCYHCNNCNHSFEDYCTINKIKEFTPNCPECSSIEVHRDFKAENVGGFSSTPKTVGMLAERNSNKMSADEKANIQWKNTEYLRKKESEYRNPRPSKER